MRVVRSRLRTGTKLDYEATRTTYMVTVMAEDSPGAILHH